MKVTVSLIISFLWLLCYYNIFPNALELDQAISIEYILMAITINILLIRVEPKRKIDVFFGCLLLLSSVNNAFNEFSKHSPNFLIEEKIAIFIAVLASCKIARSYKKQK